MGAGKRLFSSTLQPAPENRSGGRKKLLVTLCKENGYSAQDIKNGILNILTMSREEVMSIAMDSKNPMIYAILAKALNDNKTCFGACMQLLQFVYGSKIDVTTNGGNIQPNVINVSFNGGVKDNLNLNE